MTHEPGDPEHADPAVADRVESLSGSVTLSDYLADPVVQAAVERKVEIIGEAARKVSEALRAAHPEIPWRAIIVQRHVIAHQYGEDDQERMWRVATVHVPALAEQLRALVPPPPGPEP